MDTKQDGRSGEPGVQLEVDGKEIELNRFTRRFIANTVLGMVTSLRDTGRPHEVVLRVSAPGA